MRWFQRKRMAFKPFDRSALPRVEQASEEDMIEEGMMLAQAAGRMTLRNRLVVEALRGDEPYESHHVMAAAREVLYELVRQADDIAERSRDERDNAANREGKANHQHDYRRGDVNNLRRREKVYSTISRQLWELRENEEYLKEFADRARDDAWGDVAETIEARLDRVWPEIEIDGEYELARPQRLLEFEDDLKRAVKRATAERTKKDSGSSKQAKQQTN